MAKIINVNGQEIIDFKLARFDGLNCFVEILDSMVYEKEPKFIFRFIKYDPNAQSGNKYTNDIRIFMDYDKADALAAMILSGTFARMKLLAQKEGKNQLYNVMGGTTKESLAHQKRTRKDGMDESRQLFIEAGMKSAFAMKAVSGPGKKDEKGLIVPQYLPNKAEQSVIIAFSEETFIAFARAIQRKVNAMDILRESRYQKQLQEYEKKQSSRN